MSPSCAAGDPRVPYVTMKGFHYDQSVASLLPAGAKKSSGTTHVVCCIVSVRRRRCPSPSFFFFVLMDTGRVCVWLCECGGQASSDKAHLHCFFFSDKFELKRLQFLLVFTALKNPQLRQLHGGDNVSLIMQALSSMGARLQKDGFFARQGRS